LSADAMHPVTIVAPSTRALYGFWTREKRRFMGKGKRWGALRWGLIALFGIFFQK
jgi:hypothetical protein